MDKNDRQHFSGIPGMQKQTIINIPRPKTNQALEIGLIYQNILYVLGFLSSAYFCRPGIDPPPPFANLESS